MSSAGCPEGVRVPAGGGPQPVHRLPRASPAPSHAQTLLNSVSAEALPAAPAGLVFYSWPSRCTRVVRAGPGRVRTPVRPPSPTGAALLPPAQVLTQVPLTQKTHARLMTEGMNPASPGPEMSTPKAPQSFEDELEFSPKEQRTAPRAENQYMQRRWAVPHCPRGPQEAPTVC